MGNNKQNLKINIKMARAQLSGVLTQMEKSPTIIISLIFLLFHPNVLSIVLLLFCILQSGVMYILENEMHDLIAITELELFVTETNTEGIFVELDCEQVINESTDMSVNEVKDILYHDTIDRMLPRVFVPANYDGHLYSNRSFPMLEKQGIMFMDSSFEDNDAWKFKFFHELGHLSGAHGHAETLQMKAICNIFSCGILFSVILSNNLLATSIAFFATVYINGVKIAKYINLFKNNMDIEILADSFAIYMLHKNLGFKNLKAAYMKRYNHGARWSAAMDFFLDWSKETVDVSDMYIVRKVKEKAERDQADNKRSFFTILAGKISNASVNYDSMIERWYEVPEQIVFMFTSATLIAVVIGGVSINIDTLIGLIIILLAIPLLFVIILKRCNIIKYSCLQNLLVKGIKQ